MKPIKNKPLSVEERGLSGKRDSNSRPRPWQGRALPTELLPLLPTEALAKVGFGHFLLKWDANLVMLSKNANIRKINSEAFIARHYN